MTTPSKSTRSAELLGDVDRVLAGHRVDDEQDVVRLDRLADRAPARPSARRRRAGGRRCRRSATSRPSRCARRAPSAAISTGSSSAPVLVDRHRTLLAERHELLDRGRAVDVAGDERRPSCPPSSGAARASPRRSSCPSPAGRPAGSPSAACREGELASRRRPSASVSSSSTIFTTCWPGLRLVDARRRPRARSLTWAVNVLDDLEVDVGLEQREADLAHRLVDVLVGQLAVATEVAEDVLKAFAEGVEHGPVSGSGAAVDGQW